MLLIGLNSSARADIFQCRGTNGEVSFQNHPCVGPSIASTQHKSDEAGKHFLWQANKRDSRLYLLGSIHFGIAAMYPLPAIMLDSFKQSESLVVEANILDVDPVKMAQLVAAKAFYLDGSTLQQHLNADTWQQLQKVVAPLGLPPELLQAQKPWFVSMTLMTLALNQLGYDEALGIDRYFLEMAKGEKKVIELEGLAMQLDLLDSLSAEDQSAMLEETLAEMDQGKVFFERMLKAWKSGDGDEIQALFEEGADNADSERLNQLMIYNRNKTMAASLEKLAQSGGTHFVVVGAGHLPGRNGIIELLSQKGFQVSQH